MSLQPALSAIWNNQLSCKTIPLSTRITEYIRGKISNLWEAAFVFRCSICLSIAALIAGLS